MTELEKIKKMLEKDWFVAFPSPDTPVEDYADVISVLAGGKEKNIKVVILQGKLVKLKLIMIKKTHYVMKNLKLNKQKLRSLFEITIAPDQQVLFSIPKTERKEDKNKLINKVIKSLTERIENIDEKERFNLSMYR